MRKIGYYLSVSYYDFAFRTFFCLLVFKLYLFYRLTGFETFIRPFCADLGILLILLSLSLVMKSRTLKLSYLFSLDLLFSFIFFSNSLFHHYFKDFTSAFDIYQAHQLLIVPASLFNLINIEALFLADLPILPFVLLLKKKENSCNFTMSARIGAVGIIILLGLFSNRSMLLDIRGILNRAHITGDRANTIGDFGVINYQMLDAYVFVEAAIKKDTLSQSDIDAVNAALADRSGKNTARNEFSDTGKGINLIVIQVESLQNFVIGRKYLGSEITPNMSRLAEDSVSFDQIYDQTWDGNSSDATLLANGSLYPARRGAASFLYAADRFDSLPKILAEHGYATAVMSADSGSFWNNSHFEKALGFDRQFYEDAYTLNEIIGLGLSDKALFLQSTEKMEKMRRPFYVFIRTLTSHTPFSYVTRSIDGFRLADLEGKRIGHYLRSVHYLDSAIGEFLRKLSESGLLSNSVVVIYGDHRARLSVAELKSVGVNDMSEENKIPLIISIPGRTPRGLHHTVGGLVDLTPTLCNILGVDISRKFFLGKDLLGEKGKGYVIFRDASFISPDGRVNDAGAGEELRLNDLILEKNALGVLRGRGVVAPPS